MNEKRRWAKIRNSQEYQLFFKSLRAFINEHSKDNAQGLLGSLFPMLFLNKAKLLADILETTDTNSKKARAILSFLHVDDCIINRESMLPAFVELNKLGKQVYETRVSLVFSEGAQINFQALYECHVKKRMAGFNTWKTLVVSADSYEEAVNTMEQETFHVKRYTSRKFSVTNVYSKTYHGKKYFLTLDSQCGAKNISWDFVSQL